MGIILWNSSRQSDINIRPAPAYRTAGAAIIIKGFFDMDGGSKTGGPPEGGAPREDAQSFRDIVEWLLSIEGRASRVYEALAGAFKDPELKDLLSGLSRDELEHHAVLKSVFERIGDARLRSVIRVDAGSRKEVEDMFRRMEECISRGVTEDEALDFAVGIESSEFNSLFLYAAAAFDRDEFAPATAKIRQHKKRIENFLRARGLEARTMKIKGLPELWREKILVVDDEEMIVYAIQSVFENECLIANASDGAAALKMVADAYYSVIIVDVGLPVMNGIEFYKKASEAYPSIRERVLFLTGCTDESILSFLHKNGVSYITKPVGIREIKRAVVEKLAR